MPPIFFLSYISTYFSWGIICLRSIKEELCKCEWVDAVGKSMLSKQRQAKSIMKNMESGKISLLG